MFQESYMRRIAALVGVMAICALFAYTYSTIKQVKYLYQTPTTITVAGVGEIFAKPDIATFDFTVEAKEADASTAQNKSAEKMDAIVAYLKGAGVEEKDIKTGYYNLTPRYDYPEVKPCTAWGGCPQNNDEPKLIGYQVSQTVTVKVRDTKKAGELVSGVGDKGAMNVSGLTFTIDDTDVLKAQAREKAIANAKEKAKTLAKDLGTRLGRMNGYWEDEGGNPTPYYAVGGADMMKAESVSAPSRPAELPTGENTISVRVNLSYELR